MPASWFRASAMHWCMPFGYSEATSLLLCSWTFSPHTVTLRLILGYLGGIIALARAAQGVTIGRAEATRKRQLPPALPPARAEPGLPAGLSGGVRVSGRAAGAGPG